MRERKIGGETERGAMETGKPTYRLITYPDREKKGERDREREKEREGRRKKGEERDKRRGREREKTRRGGREK